MDAKVSDDAFRLLGPVHWQASAILLLPAHLRQQMMQSRLGAGIAIAGVDAVGRGGGVGGAGNESVSASADNTRPAAPAAEASTVLLAASAGAVAVEAAFYTPTTPEARGRDVRWPGLGLTQNDLRILSAAGGSGEVHPSQRHASPTGSTGSRSSRSSRRSGTGLDLSRLTVRGSIMCAVCSERK